MKRYYIYIDDIMGFWKEEFSCYAESKEDAVTKFIEQDEYWDEDDRWRIWASEYPDEVEDWHRQEQIWADYEIVDIRPIEL